jgi:hypothetical protein
LAVELHQNDRDNHLKDDKDKSEDDYYPHKGFDDVFNIIDIIIPWLRSNIVLKAVDYFPTSFQESDRDKAHFSGNPSTNTIQEIFCEFFQAKISKIDTSVRGKEIYQ